MGVSSVVMDIIWLDILHIIRQMGHVYKTAQPDISKISTLHPSNANPAKLQTANYAKPKPNAQNVHPPISCLSKTA